jgi:hypothetical protein
MAFNPLSSRLDTKSLGFTQKLDISGPTFEYYTVGSGDGEMTLTRPVNNVPAGYSAITEDGGDGGQPFVTGYYSETKDFNGIPVRANYDAEGNLTNYQSGYQKNLGGSARVSAEWDASGNAKPVVFNETGGNFLKDIMSDPVLGTVANLGAAYFGGPLGSAALAAAQGQDLGDIAKSAALSYAAGQIGGQVAGATGSQAAGQFAGNTGAGLLSGRDLESSLTNAAINTGANQAASGLMNAVNAPTATDASMTFTPSAPLNFGDTPVDYGQTGTGGLGLTATPAPLDMSNPYSFDTNYFSTGGLGFKATPAPFNPANPYSLDTNVGNRADMGGGTGIQVPPAEGATLGSIGAAAETPTQNPNLVSSVGTGLLSNYLKSLFTGSPSTGSTGTGNMATTPQNNTDLASLFGGLLGGAGSLMQGDTNVEARRTQADALRAAGQQAATASQFRPVGTTTTFGTSNFQVDPKTGQLISAGYNLSPQLQQYQNQLMAGGQQSLADAATLQNLGRGYLAQTPEAAAQQYMANQQALLAPSRDMESARLANQLQQTGRTGVAVAQGGSLGMANPEQQALANARSMQDLQLAAQAQQQGRAQTQFGQGLLTSAYDPFQAGLKAATGVEALGQQPFGMSTDLAAQFQRANAQGGALNLNAQNAATNAMLPANQYNPYASLLSGAGGSNLLTSAAGKALGNTGVGSALAKYLGGLGGYDYSALNTAASDFMTANPDIVPSSTFNGSGDASWMNDWWMNTPEMGLLGGGYVYNPNDFTDDIS